MNYFKGNFFLFFQGFSEEISFFKSTYSAENSWIKHLAFQMPMFHFTQLMWVFNSAL